LTLEINEIAVLLRFSETFQVVEVLILIMLQ